LQMILILLARGFAGQVEESMRVSSQLLETAFDATFLIGIGKTAFVQTTSDRLDEVFHRKMQGCALDETIIINGAEATLALCQGGSDTRRVFVTCRDAQGWEFDAELRTAPQLQTEKTSPKQQLCGVIVFGEKRPPQDIVGDSSVLADEESTDMLIIETQAALDDETLGAGNPLATLAEMDIRHERRPYARSLPSIPEDEESGGLISGSELSAEGKTHTLGFQVDTMKDCIAKLRSKAKKEKQRSLVKYYSDVRRFFQDDIKDILSQAQEQLLQANAPSKKSDEPQAPVQESEV